MSYSTTRKIENLLDSITWDGSFVKYSERDDDTTSSLASAATPEKNAASLSTSSPISSPILSSSSHPPVTPRATTLTLAQRPSLTPSPVRKSVGVSKTLNKLLFKKAGSPLKVSGHLLAGSPKLARSPSGRLHLIDSSTRGSSSGGIFGTNSAKSNGHTYSAWSREMFLQRLSTYQYRNWDIDATEYANISALACARHGWVAITPASLSSKNTVQCVTCKQSFVLNLGHSDDHHHQTENDKNSETSIQSVMADKYQTMLTTEHRDNCPWKGHACSELDQIYTLPMMSVQQGQEFRVRYHSFDKIDPTVLRMVNISPIGPPDSTDAEIVKQFLSRIKLQSKDNNERDSNVENKVLLLSLLGWSLVVVGNDNNNNNNSSPTIANQHQLVGCGYCFRKVLLDTKGDHSFDLVTEHRDYCPFVSLGHADNYGRREIGWRALSKLLTCNDSANNSPLAKVVLFDNNNNKSNDDSLNDDLERSLRLKRLSKVYFNK